jgi:hypothetical protein
MGKASAGFLSSKANGHTYVGQSLYESDMEVFSDIRNPFLEIVVEEVLQLTSELDTGGTTADDDHVKQSLDLFGVLILECCRLAAVHDTSSDGLSIIDFLEKETMLAHSRNT